VAIVGADREASTAHELDLLRSAGCVVRVVDLEHGPVFVNIEQPGGRRQLCHDRSDPIPVAAVDSAWRSAPGWLLAPVAGELPEAWAAIPGEAAHVAVGWQGLLRELVPGEEVRPVDPGPHPIVRRADLVGISRDDVEVDLPLAALYAALRAGATLAVTHGDRGGLIATARDATDLQLRHYPAIPSHRVVDPTGAGDVFLAALAAARIQPRLVGGRIAQGYDLLLASAAASLVLEAPGVTGVPDRAAVVGRMREGLADASRRILEA
jgi:hypothetical protein